MIDVRYDGSPWLSVSCFFHGSPVEIGGIPSEFPVSAQAPFSAIGDGERASDRVVGTRRGRWPEQGEADLRLG